VQYTSNKGFAEDLTEGKFSFPIVHGIHADTSNRQILSKSIPVYILPPLLILFRCAAKATRNPNAQETCDIPFT
jgi:hypothetical protein